jgi:hypothetical protein
VKSHDKLQALWRVIEATHIRAQSLNLQNKAVAVEAENPEIGSYLAGEGGL